VSSGRKDLKLIVRVAHIWLIRDKDNPDEIIFMNMLLVDEKVCSLKFIMRFVLLIYHAIGKGTIHITVGYYYTIEICLKSNIVVIYDISLQSYKYCT